MRIVEGRVGPYMTLGFYLCEMDTTAKCHDPAAALLRQGNKTEVGTPLRKTEDSLGKMVAWTTNRGGD